MALGARATALSQKIAKAGGVTLYKTGQASNARPLLDGKTQMSEIAKMDDVAVTRDPDSTGAAQTFADLVAYIRDATAQKEG